MSIAFPIETASMRWQPKLSQFVQVNPFGFKQTTFDWSGELREAVIKAPITDEEDLGKLEAFILEAGLINTFTYTNDRLKNPRGTATGTPLINGASQTGSDLITDGWTASTAILYKGDTIAISGRLFTILADVSSDAGGNATLSLWPRIPEAYADNTAIVVGSSITGNFKLITQVMPEVVPPVRGQSVSLSMREVLS